VILTELNEFKTIFMPYIILKIMVKLFFIHFEELAYHFFKGKSKVRQVYEPVLTVME